MYTDSLCTLYTDSLCTQIWYGEFNKSAIKNPHTIRFLTLNECAEPYLSLKYILNVLVDHKKDFN